MLPIPSLEVHLLSPLFLLSPVDRCLPGMYHFHRNSTSNLSKNLAKKLPKFLIFTHFLSQRSDHPSTDHPGKALLIVLLILLSIITLLLCSIDRIYSPWIINFLHGKIFLYCVQVSALITTTSGICYLFAILTLGLCSKKGGCGSQPTLAILRVVREDEARNKYKSSFVNPCYNIEFSLKDSVLLERGVGQGVTQV